MKIHHIETAVISTPLERPVRSYVRVADHTVLLIARVHADDGEGVGFVTAFTVGTARALAELVTELGAALRGTDAGDIDAAHRRMRETLRLIGPSGPSASAIAAVDLALWDLKGRALGLPVHRLFGSRHRRLDGYASDGLWLMEPDQVVREAQATAEAGFTAMKVRVGRPDVAADVEVLERVRDAVGDGITLMVDANQGWNLETAWSVGPKLAAVGVAWLEEPLPADDLDGYSRLTGFEVPIAAGESAFEAAPLRQLVDSGAVSIVMPDLQRLGGASGWRRAVAPIRRRGVSVASHLYPEFSVHLLAAEPHPGPVEWVDWNRPFAAPATLPRGGVIDVPDTPGFGLTYDWDAVRSFTVHA